ncbi:MAG: COG1361 S-layer family protein [Candidatus Diapherotrites archaeon]
MKRNIILVLAVLMIAQTVFAANLAIDSVNYSPSPATPGKYMDLWVHVKNTGGQTLKDVVFQLDLKGAFEIGTGAPFMLESGDTLTRNLGNINGGQSAIVKFRLLIEKNAFDGDYTFGLLYGEDGQATNREPLTIKIVNRKPDLEIVGVYPENIAPGQSEQLELTIRNVGTEDATNVLVGVSEDRTVTSTGVVVERYITPVGASMSFISIIAAGETAIVKINVVANPEAELKAHTVPVTLEYKDGNSTTNTEIEYIGLRVIQDAELDAIVNSSTPLAMPGGTSEIKVDLFNAGIGSAKYIIAELSSNAGEFEGKKVFIGTMEADDFDSFRINMNIRSDVQPGNHTINLKLNYKDQFGEPKEVMKELDFKVYSAMEVQAKNGSGFDLWFTVVVLAVLIVAGRWAYKKYIKKK